MNPAANPFHVEYDGAAPPLPRKMFIPRRWSRRIRKVLPAGCHAFFYEPLLAWKEQHGSRLNAYLGPLRVEYVNWSLRCSGDLYLVRNRDLASMTGEARSEGVVAQLRRLAPEEAVASLQFPFRNYRYYLVLNGLKRVWRALRFFFFAYRLNEDGAWDPPRQIYFDVRAGELGGEHRLYNLLGTQIGGVRFEHVADHLRQATVDVESLADCGRPAEQRFWNSLRDDGWRVRIRDLPEPIGEAPSELVDPSWQLEDLRRYLASRESYLGDSESVSPLGHQLDPWRYSLQSVELVYNGTSSTFGFMYDNDERRGAAVSAHAPAVRGRERPWLQEVPRLFHRVALHEFGHLLGLYHGEKGSLMQAEPVRWKWQQHLVGLRPSAIDATRLRHLPDVWVRPGALPFGHRYRPSSMDIQDLVPLTPTSELELIVRSVNGHPFEGLENGGAEGGVRVGEALSNIGLSLRKDSGEPVGRIDGHLAVPIRDNLASIRVTSPVGGTRDVVVARLPPVELQPGGYGEVLNFSILLFECKRLRRLVFRACGIHEMAVELVWTDGKRYFRVAASCQITAE